MDEGAGSLYAKSPRCHCSPRGLETAGRVVQRQLRLHSELRIHGARQFYQERTPGSDNFELIVKDAKGKRKLVDIGAIRAAHGGEPYSINYFLAAPDGSKVAVGISQGGSEDAQLYVYEAATGKQIAGPIERAEYGVSAWSGDSRLLYFIRLQKVAKGDEINKYKNVTVQAVGSEVGAAPGCRQRHRQGYRI